MSHPKPSVSATPWSTSSSADTTTVTQCQRTASTTTLKILGDNRYPWVTPRYPLNGVPKCPLACAIIVSIPQ